MSNLFLSIQFSLDPKSLRTDSTKPDPMSIGVYLVIFFFVIVILVISSSFIFYHNQKKNHMRELQIPQRKFFLNSFSPYLSSNNAQHQIAQQVTASRLPNRPQAPTVNSSQANCSINNRTQAKIINSPAQVCGQMMHTQGSQSTNQSHGLHIAPANNMVPVNTLCKGQFQSELSTLTDRGLSSGPVNLVNMVKRQPDIVTPSGHTTNSNNSFTNASESASMVATRMQMPVAASSIYTTHTNSENYTDNYSNILASAEHYDLENASSIAPSDIDIVYHYKGFRNRDTLAAHQRHAPLSRLSPSVSELSSAPRILTLQDLSPQAPPPPPSLPMNVNMNRGQLRKQMAVAAGRDDDVAVMTENSFNCSEYVENYDLCKKDKNLFQRVW